MIYKSVTVELIDKKLCQAEYFKCYNEDVVTQQALPKQ